MATNPQDFAAAYLRMKGYPVTPASLEYLHTQQRWEGGHTNNDATFNWLNSTSGDQYPKINSVGVRAYPDFQTGLSYLDKTLNNGHYPDIVRGLASGNPYKYDIRDDLSTWVSGKPDSAQGRDYAKRVMGSHYTADPAKFGQPSGPAQVKQAAPTRSLAAVQQPQNDKRTLLINMLAQNNDNPLLYSLLAANKAGAQQAKDPTSAPQAAPAAQQPTKATPGYGVNGGIDTEHVNPGVLNTAKKFGLHVTSGFRSVAYQAELYKNRSASGSVGKPGKSNHNFGAAVDVSPNEQGKAFLEYAFAHPEEFKEVFYDPAGKSIKNGKIVNYTIGGHSDHIHFAQ